MLITLSIGPRVRKSPISAARADGRCRRVYNHMYMPTGYGDPPEYDRLVNGVAMWTAAERQVALKALMRWSCTLSHTTKP